MATVRTTLQMHDMFTRPLNSLTQALNTSLNAMQGLQHAVDQNTNIAATYEAARDRVLETGAAMEKMAEDINRAGQEQEKFNDQMGEGNNLASDLVGKITRLVGAYVGLRTAKNFFLESRDAANDWIRAEQRLQSIMGNINGMTQDGIELVRRQALQLEKNTAIAADIGMYGQSQLAQYVYDPNNINALTEAMYNLATETYGVNVAQEQIKQTADLIGKAMMGQIDALSRNGFKLSSILTDAEIKMFKYGTEVQRTALLVEVLNENQRHLAEQMANTPEGKIARLGIAWADVKKIIGYGVLQEQEKVVNYLLTNMPIIQNVLVGTFNVVMMILGTIGNAFSALGGAIAQALKRDAIQDFLTVLLGAWSVIELLAKNIVQKIAILWDALINIASNQIVQTALKAIIATLYIIAVIGNEVISFVASIVNGLTEIEPVLWGIASLLAGVILPKLWASVLAIKAQLIRTLENAVAWAVLNWQITLVFLAIGLVITVLHKLGVTADQILGYVGGLFGVLYATVYNVIAYMWNGFASFAEFLINLFIDPVYAVKKLFYDLATNALGHIKTMISGLETLINLIPGVKLDFTNKIDSLIKSLEKPTSDKDVVNISKMGFMDYGNAAKAGYGIGSNVGSGIMKSISGVSNLLKTPEMPGLTGMMGTGAWDIDNINSVGEVGKIKDKVDISSEDLKTMRDLAEMKSIQNFVTLTPTVQVTHTGDINNGQDINMVVARINKMLEEQIVSSAQGVYA